MEFSHLARLHSLVFGDSNSDPSPRGAAGPPARVSGQLAATAVHLRTLQAWRPLPHEEQLRWEPYASVVEPHRPPFDHKARISGYTSIYGLDLDSYQVHARCILLDTKTGYRSQFFAVSGVVSL